MISGKICVHAKCIVRSWNIGLTRKDNKMTGFRTN